MAKHCKCKQDECEECPEWIFTFADLVMLMMGFFVILWVLKPSPGKAEQALDPKWLEVIGKIREAFGHIPDPDSKDPVDRYLLMKKIEQLQLPLKGPGQGGATKIKPRGAQGTDPEVRDIRPGSESAVGGRVMFAAGDGNLA